jgi:hypothetical protein
MLNPSSVRIDVNDLFEELREENNTLLKQLLFAQKCQKLLEKYRNNLNNICINCKCDQNFENKLIFNDLETEYKSVSEEYSQEFNNNLKVINNFDNKSINNTNKRTLNEMTINESFNKKHKISNNESNNEFPINENLEKTEIKIEINSDCDEDYDYEDSNEEVFDSNPDLNTNKTNYLKTGFDTSKTLIVFSIFR